MYIIILLVYSIGHFIIDLTTGLTHYGQTSFYLFSTGSSPAQTLLYNTLAFGIQPFLGYFIDRWNLSRQAAILGCLFAGSSLLIIPDPLFSIIFAGTGNALYHLGAGVAVFRLFPKKAWPLGVFVGPGALGIAWSRTLGINATDYLAPVLTVLIFLTFMIIFLPSVNQVKHKYLPLRVSRTALLVISLLMISTIIRSFVGLNLNFPWKSGANMLSILVLAVALGKIIGGFAADYFGRITSSAIALAISAPLIAYGATIPTSGILGVFFFQTTMAVTLLAIYWELPGHPAFSFGLLCFGLWIGALFTQTIPIPVPPTPIPVTILILVSCLALSTALWIQLRKRNIQTSE